MATDNSMDVTEAILSSVAKIDELKKAIVVDSGGLNLTVPHPQLLNVKLNEFAKCLKAMHSAGKNLNDITAISVPIDIFKFLDGEVSNPDLYQHKSLEDIEAKARLIGDRIQYLETLKDNIVAHIPEALAEEANDRRGEMK